jgi:hypothetical protein
MRSRINHITKLEFLPCSKAAFDAAITKNNILGGVRGAGLVPHNPEAVTSKLDVRLHTPPLPTIEDSPWQSQTLSNTRLVTAPTDRLRVVVRTFTMTSLYERAH